MNREGLKKLTEEFIRTLFYSLILQHRVLDDICKDKNIGCQHIYRE